MDRRKVKSEYKLSRRTMGVYAIRNLKNDRVFIGSALNLDGSWNSNKFKLGAGSHPSKELQSDWNALGDDNFGFEILEELPPRSDPDYDYKEDLEVLEDLWLEKFEPFDEKGYNERKKTREERLRMISARRKR